MKIPKEILSSIKLCSKHSAIALTHNDIIRNWFDENGLSQTDEAADMLIDCIESGAEDHEGLIDYLKSVKEATP